MSGLFEHIAAADDSALIAQRQAAAVATKRVKDRFGAFLANAHDRAELTARLSLVAEDLTQVVQDVVGEYGGDAQKIEAAIRHSMMPGQMGAPMGAPVGAPMGTPQGAPAGATPPGGAGTATCPQCGGQMVNGQCPTCQGGAYGGAAGSPAGAYGLTHSIPQAPSSGPVQASHEAKGGFCDTCRAWKSGPNAGCTCDGDGGGEAAEDENKESSVRESRRPKLCPYHSEAIDISLGSGDPQAGFNAMSPYAWSERHCKGGFEGSCNFRPAMVTQKYWDDKEAEYAERREQRQLAPEPVAPELSIDTEPITYAEPLPDEPGKEGVSDIDGELAAAPSAVGEMAVAASTKEAEALKTVKLPTGDDSALGGPSPKIDKARSGDEGGWSLDPIKTEGDGSPHPTRQQHPTDKADYTKEEFLDQTDAAVKSETLPTSTNFDDAGFHPERNIEQYPTKTFPKGNQANPVTRESISHRTAGKTECELCSNRVDKSDTRVVDGLRLCADCRGTDTADKSQVSELERENRQSAIDPDKNPIRELLEEYENFLMPNQVEAALQDWSVG